MFVVKFKKFITLFCYIFSILYVTINVFRYYLFGTTICY